VKCAECHKLFKEVADKNVLFYKPTPKDCAACHGPNIPVAGNRKTGM
jgi:mono/diheme cytochrome c family protein